jgi:L-asparaginase
MPMTPIYIVTTGGTIEKTYSEQTGSVVNIHNKIHAYLGLLRLPDCDIFIVPLLNKDSLEITDADRRLILGTVKGLLTENAPIIVTHGTDTMVETGLYLKQAIPHPPVPIILTGAMIPLGFERSDGLQNLTESLFAVRLLPAGIYVVMHNRAFPVDRVRKDHGGARFIWCDPGDTNRTIQ